MLENISILVPLDFSDLSLKGLYAARTMAQSFEGSITPMHAYIPITEMDGPYTIGLGPGAHEDYEEIESTLQERLDDAAEEHIDKKYLRKGIIAVGNPAYTIIEASKDYDMIAMSTHGRTGFSRLILGSVAEKVLRLSHIPVLIIEKEAEFDTIDRILVTTDFSENSTAAFPYAREISNNTGATLDLLHILSHDQVEKKQTSDSVFSLRKQRLDLLTKEHFHQMDDRFNHEVLVSDETPHEAILNRTEEHDYDLIIMATVGRTGLEYLMMGSTTANVVRYARTPVLSINPKRKKEEPEEDL